MELRKFKEKNPKKLGIILFTISCILLISGVILYRTFAIFQVDTTQNVINGSIEDPGDIYFAFYKDGNIQKEMPRKEEGYILDEQESSCGVNGTNVDSIKVSLTEDWKIVVEGVTTSRTKCNLYFIKGIYILGKGVPIVTEGDGLYEVKHENVSGTLNDTGFQQTEYRYAGSNPNNYIKFNNELWRIIGLVNVMTSETNVEQRVKIVKETIAGNEMWSEDKLNYWASSSLQKNLNTTYFNKLENISNAIEKDMYWNIGFLSSYNQYSTIVAYNEERGTLTDNENSTIWKGAIALIYPSDYGLATGLNIESRNHCLKGILNSWNINSSEYQKCVINNWLRDSENNQWTLTRIKDNTHYVAYLNQNGFASQNFGQYSNYRPSLYLKTTVKIIANSGTSSNPFELAQIIK